MMSMPIWLVWQYDDECSSLLGVFAYQSEARRFFQKQLDEQMDLYRSMCRHIDDAAWERWEAVRERRGFFPGGYRSREDHDKRQDEALALYETVYSAGEEHPDWSRFFPFAIYDAETDDLGKQKVVEVIPPPYDG